ncbi:MAG: carotenoid oxygenase family protein, partial [Parachlamydiaceae bacterium]
MNTNLSNECYNVKLNIKGYFPEWLKGTFVRNGPVDTFLNGISNRHWFDGLSKLHAFTFKEEGVFYSSSFLKTDAYKAVKVDKTLNYTGFAVDPCRALFKSFFIHHLAPNANVNVSKIQEAYVALTEIPLPIRFDLETTKTLGPFSFSDNLPTSGCWESAHPHILENESYSYLVDIGFTSRYVLTKRSNGSDKREVLKELSVKNPSYMHSFSVTENKIILSEYPLRLNPLTLMFRLKP